MLFVDNTNEALSMDTRQSLLKQYLGNKFMSLNFLNEISYYVTNNILQMSTVVSRERNLICLVCQE